MFQGIEIFSGDFDVQVFSAYARFVHAVLSEAIGNDEIPMRKDFSIFCRHLFYLPAVKCDVKFGLKGTETGKVSFADAGFTEIYSTSAYSEFGADFGLHHAAHVTIQNGNLQCR